MRFSSSLSSKENTKYNKIQVRITHYSKIFEDEGSHLMSFEWKHLRCGEAWGSLNLFGLDLSQKKKSILGPLMWLSNLQKPQIEKLVASEQTNSWFKVHIREIQSHSCSYCNHHQSMGLSLSQPVIQGPCQMPCENPLEATLSKPPSPVLAASKGQREKEDGQGVTANTFQLVGSFHLLQTDGRAV